ncbi:unnamed protein product [Leptosia nina]|uniref:folate gamma-glutamyl hydrolase n=1 Tax=Leptosia nina TaxID=320188 RepID=A0AAV1JPP5_9NEOP
MKYFIFLLCVLYTDATQYNDRPTIGVLSQETYSTQHLFPGENYTSFIAASYVKNIEASGARVVPILIGRNRSYYRELLGKINGVVFPGGATYFNQSNGYADAGQYIYEIAQELNDAGHHFPIFGTCLGFELLIILASGRGRIENRGLCYSYRSRPLSFTTDFRCSKMYAEMPDDVVNILRTQSVTVNAHQFCIFDENLRSHNLTNDWRVTSYSTDNYGVPFISSIEHRRYPFFGTQFHPETVSYEWRKTSDIPHTPDALTANRYFMDFFVKESRKNENLFPDKTEEDQHLIYNYAARFTGALGGYYEQIYVFEPREFVLNYK